LRNETQHISLLLMVGFHGVQRHLQGSLLLAGLARSKICVYYQALIPPAPLKKGGKSFSPPFKGGWEPLLGKPIRDTEDKSFSPPFKGGWESLLGKPIRDTEGKFFSPLFKGGWGGSLRKLYLDD
jgi:hypothetical protein